MSRLNRLTTSPKWYLADPALAVSLLNISADKLLAGGEGDIVIPRDGTLLGALFESLAALNIRVFAQGAEAEIAHSHDLRHLLWLKDRLGDSLIDMVVLTTGKHAYRRKDGVAVVPMALLGP